MDMYLQHVHMHCAYGWIFECMCVCVCMFVCTYVYVRLCGVCVCMQECCMHVCVHVCMSISPQGKQLSRSTNAETRLARSWYKNNGVRLRPGKACRGFSFLLSTLALPVSQEAERLLKNRVEEWEMGVFRF